MKKLTSKVLDRLIREVLAEQKHEPFKSDYERVQHVRKQREEAEERRQKKKELRPDYDLMRLSKGILEEGELLAEPSDDGYVKIKAAALHRMLNESTEQIMATCNKHRYFQLDQILGFISKLEKAQKGKD
jgi:hypothetical protein